MFVVYSGQHCCFTAPGSLGYCLCNVMFSPGFLQHALFCFSFFPKTMPVGGLAMTHCPYVSENVIVCVLYAILYIGKILSRVYSHLTPSVPGI